MGLSRNRSEAARAINAIDQALAVKAGTRDAKSALRRLCSSLLRESGQIAPPFRIRPLLDLMNVEFSYEDLSKSKEEAAVKLIDGKLQLAIPKARFRGGSGRSRRWRFSIAHEFAHVILIRAVGARIVDLANSSEETYEYVEKLCDFGASQLLMPRSSLREALRARRFSQLAVFEIAELFDVSISSLLWSAADLLPNGGLIQLKEYRRSAQESNELRVWSVFSRYGDSLDEPWLPTGCTMKHIRVGQRPLGFEHLSVRGALPIELVLGKSVRRLSARMVDWQYGSKASSFLDRDQSSFGVGGERGLLLACAPAGKFDAGLFGEIE